MIWLAIVHSGPNCLEPVPMADTNQQDLLKWLEENAKGHAFTLWEMHGVMVKKVGYYINQA